jgi:hypothetical protein
MTMWLILTTSCSPRVLIRCLANFNPEWSSLRQSALPICWETTSLRTWRCEQSLVRPEERPIRAGASYRHSSPGSRPGASWSGPETDGRSRIGKERGSSNTISVVNAEFRKRSCCQTMVWDSLRLQRQRRGETVPPPLNINLGKGR